MRASTCLITNCILEQNNHVYHSCMKQYIYISVSIFGILNMSGNSYRGHIHLRYLPYFKHVLYPSNFWFSKFIAGKLGRQVIFILPFVFSLTIQLDNFNYMYRVFWVFLIFPYNDVQLQFHGQHAFRISFTVFLYIVFMYT